MHDDISLMQFVIPGLTPYQVRGRLRNPASFWILAFAGMTRVPVMNDLLYGSAHSLISLPQLLIKFKTLAGHAIPAKMDFDTLPGFAAHGLCLFR